MTQEKRTVLPTKFATAWDDERNLPKHEARNYSEHLPVDTGRQSTHKPVAADAPLEDKVYYFPESYNALRRYLHDEFPNLWNVVGHAMAFDAPKFLEMMDAALDMKTTFDSAKVGAICHRYLNALRAKRGLSPIPGTGAEDSLTVDSEASGHFKDIEKAVEILDQFGRPLT